MLITTGNTFYRSGFKYKWTTGKKFVSLTLMKFLGTASMAAGRPCGDPSTMFFPYVQNRVHTYFEFFSCFTEVAVFNEHCILIATITVCQFIQNKSWSLLTMICPTEKSAHIYLLKLQIVSYPANIDWRMTGRCHVKATTSDTNRAYNEWTFYFYIERWFALRRSALRDSLNGFVSTGVCFYKELYKSTLTVWLLNCFTVRL